MMRPRADWAYAASLLPPCLVLCGNIAGGLWTLAYFGYLAAMVTLSAWGPRHSARLSTDKTIPDLVLALHAIIHPLNVALFVWAVQLGWLTGATARYALYATGICAGMSGMTAAHEMIHRRRKAWRAAGIVNLVLLNYGHYFVEHLRGHHRNVGSPSDPATARYGESFYRYFFRSMPGQLVHALRLEAARLRSRGCASWGPANIVVAFSLLQISICTAIGVGLGIRPLVFYLLVSLLSAVTLSVGEYMEHYGLVRERGARVAAAHSWQSSRLLERVTSLELSCHAEHHLRAAKPYHELSVQGEGPQYACGYAGMAPLVLVPPLWFRAVHPLLDRAQ